jgi:hypothetical protein
VNPDQAGFDDQKTEEEKTQALGLHKGRPWYWRSLQPSKEKIQYFKK